MTLDSRVDRPPPQLGADTDAALRELGFGADEIAALREQGAFGKVDVREGA